MITKLPKYTLQRHRGTADFGWTIIANVTNPQTAYGFYDFLTRIRPAYFEPVTGGYRVVAPDGTIECQKIYSGPALEGEKDFDHRNLLGTDEK